MTAVAWVLAMVGFTPLGLMPGRTLGVGRLAARSTSGSDCSAPRRRAHPSKAPRRFDRLLDEAELGSANATFDALACAAGDHAHRSLDGCRSQRERISRPNAIPPTNAATAAVAVGCSSALVLS